LPRHFCRWCVQEGLPRV